MLLWCGRSAFTCKETWEGCFWALCVRSIHISLECASMLLQSHRAGWMVNLPQKNVSYFMVRCGNCIPEVCERCFISFSCLLLQPVCLFQTEAQDPLHFWVEGLNSGAAAAADFLSRFSIISCQHVLEIILKWRCSVRITVCCFCLNSTESFTKYMSWWNLTYLSGDLYCLYMRINSDLNISQCLLYFYPKHRSLSVRCWATAELSASKMTIGVCSKSPPCWGSSLFLRIDHQNNDD